MVFIFKEVIMETADELMKIINNSIDDKYWIAPYVPKKCVLNKYWHLINVPGYVAEIYDRCKEKNHIFIANESNEDCFHSCTNVFKIPSFKHRCLWVDESDITITQVGEFYI